MRAFFKVEVQLMFLLMKAKRERETCSLEASSRGAGSSLNETFCPLLAPCSLSSFSGSWAYCWVRNPSFSSKGSFKELVLLLSLVVLPVLCSSCEKTRIVCISNSKGLCGRDEALAAFFSFNNKKIGLYLAQMSFLFIKRDVIDCSETRVLIPSNVWLVWIFRRLRAGPASLGWWVTYFHYSWPRCIPRSKRFIFKFQTFRPWSHILFL